jgi:peptide/nickel transport system substrate-binding protein
VLPARRGLTAGTQLGDIDCIFITTKEKNDMRKRKWTPAAVAAVALVLGLAEAGCTSSASTASAGGSGTVFTMTTEASGPFPDSFNPFVTSTYSGYIEHLIYEPLEQINYAKLTLDPWLATGYTWSDGGRTMTLNIRPGVTWSNGKPFTASDVAFTFQLMKKFPAANVDALPIASASAPSRTTSWARSSSPKHSGRKSQIPRRTRTLTRSARGRTC